jgi:hypothetical protein
MPAMGILFHHTVEMLLKGGLAQKRKLPELEAKTLSAGSTVATTVTFHPNMIGDEAIKVAVRRAVARLA